MSRKLPIRGIWISLLVLLSFITILTPTFAIQHCYLDIYVRDQDHNPLVASVYIDNYYVGQYSHTKQRVTAWDTHLVEATKTGYTSDSKYVSCACSKTKKVYLTLRKIQQYGNLDVKVTDCATSEPISGAGVSVTGEENKNGQSDSSGHAIFNNLKVGNYHISVSKSGYSSGQGDARVYADQTTRVNICLEKTCIPNWQCGPWSSCVNGIQTRLCSDGCGNTRTETRACSESCGLRVHVHDMKDEPIEGALVELDSTKKITSDDGIVLFDNLNLGTYYISAEKTGYKKDSTRAECEGGKIKDVYLYLKYTTGNLKVHVSDCETNKPLIGAKVNVINGIELNGITNEYGYAYFGNIPTREYEVSAIKEGYISNYQNIFVYEDQMSVANICLNKDDNIRVDIDSGDLEVSPSIICMDRDDTIDISLPITLEDGDDVRFKVKFYIQTDFGWGYIGKDEKTLKENDEKEFEVEYEYNRNTLKEGIHRIKAVIKYNDKEEERYGYLTVKDCAKERVDFDIGNIQLEPSSPKIGDVVVGRVPIKLMENGEEEEIINVEAWVDGRLEKSERLSFQYVGQIKEFEFAFDTSSYGIGYHTIKIIGKYYKTKESEIGFYILGEEYARKHCLRINKITEKNPPVKVGEKVKIGVEVENCGDYFENNIYSKLEDSDTLFAPQFSLKAGEQKEILFEFDAAKTENITVKVWNTYNIATKEYALKVYHGILSIHLKPEYFLYVNEDNKIRFSVKNVGKVDDVFELYVPDDVAGWVSGLPDKIDLKKGESKDIEIVINPNVSPGDYEFEIYAKTAGSETSAKTRLKVGERWTIPTAWFVFTGGILPWIIILILILLLLILLFMLLKKYRPGNYQNKYKKQNVNGGDELLPKPKILKDGAREFSKPKPRLEYYPIKTVNVEEEEETHEKSEKKRGGVWWPIFGEKNKKSKGGIWWPIKEEDKKEEIPTKNNF